MILGKTTITPPLLRQQNTIKYYLIQQIRAPTRRGQVQDDSALREGTGYTDLKRKTYFLMRPISHRLSSNRGTKTRGSRVLVCENAARWSKPRLGYPDFEPLDLCNPPSMHTSGAHPVLSRLGSIGVQTVQISRVQHNSKPSQLITDTSTWSP